MTSFERISSEHMYQFLWSLLSEMEATRKILSHDLRSTAGKARAFFDILLENLFSDSSSIPPEAKRSQDLLMRMMDELDSINKTFGKHRHKIAWVVESLNKKKEVLVSNEIIAFTGISSDLSEFESFFPNLLLYPIAGPTMSDRNEFELKIRKIQVRYYDEEKWTKSRLLDSVLAQ